MSQFWSRSIWIGNSWERLSLLEFLGFSSRVLVVYAKSRVLHFRVSFENGNYEGVSVGFTRGSGLKWKVLFFQLSKLNWVLFPVLGFLIIGRKVWSIGTICSYIVIRRGWRLKEGFWKNVLFAIYIGEKGATRDYLDCGPFGAEAPQESSCWHRYWSVRR